MRSLKRRDELMARLSSGRMVPFAIFRPMNFHRPAHRPQTKLAEDNGRHVMWRFIRSPRRVLGTVLIALCLCVCCMIPYSYWDRPRIEVASVSQDWMDLCLSARVTYEGETFVYRTWFCTKKRETANPNCDVLSAELNSADFLQRYRQAVVKHDGHLSALFQGSAGDRLAFRCKAPKYVMPPSHPAPVEDFDGMVVRGIFSKRFSVSRPTYQWSGWFQTRLPFMPDSAKLQKEADMLNHDAIDALDAQLRLLHPDFDWSVRPDWSWSVN
jgi:hypothetical protein